MLRSDSILITIFWLILLVSLIMYSSIFMLLAISGRQSVRPLRWSGKVGLFSAFTIELVTCLLLPILTHDVEIHGVDEFSLRWFHGMQPLMWYLVVVSLVAIASVGLELPRVMQQGATVLLGVLLIAGQLALVSLEISYLFILIKTTTYLVITAILTLGFIGLPTIYLIVDQFCKRPTPNRGKYLMVELFVVGFLVVYLVVVHSTAIYWFLNDTAFFIQTVPHLG